MVDLKLLTHFKECVFNNLTERLPNPQLNHHHAKSSFQTLVDSFQLKNEQKCNHLKMASNGPAIKILSDN